MKFRATMQTAAVTAIAMTGLAFTPTADASVTDIRVSALPATVDMDAIGGLDWVVWNGVNDDFSPGNVPKDQFGNPQPGALPGDQVYVFDQKLGGTAINTGVQTNNVTTPVLELPGPIGLDGAFGGEGIALFDWSDGTGTTSAIGINPGAVANTDSSSKFFEFDVNVDNAGSYTLSVIMGVFEAGSSSQVATLDSDGSSLTANFTDSSGFGPANYALVEVDFTTTGADLLTFRGNEGSGGSANTFLVSAALVPEPGTLALLGLGGALTLMRRRTA